MISVPNNRPTEMKSDAPRAWYWTPSMASMLSSLRTPVEWSRCSILLEASLLLIPTSSNPAAPIMRDRVDPVRTEDFVAAVAREPLEPVVSRTEISPFVARAASDDVRTVVADQGLGTVAAVDDVVAVAAPGGHRE